METKNKKIYIITIGIVAIIILGFFGLNYFIESKIKEQLNENQDNVKIKYEAIHVNSLGGNVSISKPIFYLKDKLTNKQAAKIELDKITINNFSYWNYFINDKIQLNELLFKQPKVTYYQNDSVKSNSSKDFFKNLKKIIQIESIEIQDANVEIYDSSNDSLVLKSEHLNFKIDEIKLNPLAQNQPITYKDFNVNSKAIFYKINEFENLFVESLNVNPKSSKIKELKIKTKYSKEALSKFIKVERDHYDLAIQSIAIENQKFGYKNDSIFYFKSDRTDVNNPNFKIYRDKIVEDDLSFKPLFSKMLRDLNFSLTLNNLFLNNATVSYIEKVKPDTNGGKLDFSKLNAHIKNLSNTYTSKDSTTSISVQAIFMEKTPIDVDWYFNSYDLDDKFVFKAKMGRLNAESMNQFMEPNLNIQLNGEIKQTYFIINGNDNTSNIDLKIKYDDFNVELLKDKTKKKNKFLSSIINIFVSKDSEDVSGDFRKGRKEDVERVKNKSVFNYLWINIKEGLLNAMTGDGRNK